MDEFASKIEALEHRWMRSWMQRDRNQLKAMTARDFIFLLGGEQAAILDRASWLEAATTRFSCESYRFDQVYVHRHGSIAVFATQMHIEARLGGSELKGPVWIFDLWKKAFARGKWRLAERSLSRPDKDGQLVDAVRSMQLWR
ncbi:nuclear transport factor 2 family protein [Qipengyuania sp.]|uniref:nuclear transport factor 2 family protein n=1 Tax=Qipengyuania sp. TaxID=2004515 RepID=UPI0035C7E9CA